jgi:hypothetical protein
MKFLAHTAGGRPSIRLPTDRQGGGLGEGDLLDPTGKVPHGKTGLSTILEGGYSGRMSPSTQSLQTFTDSGFAFISAFA